MLKLNNYDFEFDELFEEAPVTIDIRLKHVNDLSIDIEVRGRAVWILSGEYQELAYAHYVLENYDEVKPYLQKAAPFSYLTGFDLELKEHNNEWTIQSELNTALLFGDETIIDQLSDIADSFKTSSVTLLAVFLYDQLLIKIGTGKKLLQTEIQEALTEAKKTKDKDVQQYILPLIEAISALVSNDQSLWQTSIDKVIKWHADECKFGDYKNDVNGIMSLNALTMAKLGKNMHGWVCSTDSLYLPLYLINE